MRAFRLFLVFAMTLMTTSGCNRLRLMISRPTDTGASDPIFIALSPNQPLDPSHVVIAASTSLAASGVALCVTSESKDCNLGLGHYYTSQEKLSFKDLRFFLLNVRIPLQDKLQLTAVSFDTNGQLLGSKVVEIKQK